MRIIAGLAGGLILEVPRVPGLRPTSDRTRQAIFSALADRVADATVLDLFAGTGALGLEAASRGAAAVTFVEQDRRGRASLARNLTAVQHQPDWTATLEILPGPVKQYLAALAASARQFSLVLADPPYGNGAQELLADARLLSLLGPDGLLVLESAKRSALSIPGAWHLKRDAVHGDTRVSFLTRAD